MPWRTVLDDWIEQPQEAAEPGAWAVDRGLLILASAPTRRYAEGGGPTIVSAPHGLAWNLAAASSRFVNLGTPPSGSAFSFVVIANQGAASGQFLISSRLSGGTVDGGVEILAGGGGAGTAELRMARGGVAYNTTPRASGLNDGRYYVHVGTYGDGALRHYVNGVFVGSISVSGSVTHSQPLYIGRRGSTYIDAQVSDVAWLNGITLTADEIAQIATPEGYYSQFFAPVERRIWIPAGGSGPTYTLTADGATYSLTAPAANLKASRKLAAAVGSFSVTGADVGLYVQRRIVAGQASYSYTGTNVNLKVSRKLVAGTGTYSLTGQDATLTYFGGFGPTYTLSAGAGSYSITGTNVSLKVSRKLVAEAGSYTYSGSSVGLSYSGAVSNMPPYITVYFWRRTA